MDILNLIMSYKNSSPQMSSSLMKCQWWLATCYALSNYVLNKQCVLKTHFKLFQTKLILLVDDLAQLLEICGHTIQNNDILCKPCHIKFVPSWKIMQHHFISISIRQTTNLKYLQLFNIIWSKKPNIVKINKVLLKCFIQNQK